MLQINAAAYSHFNAAKLIIKCNVLSTITSNMNAFHASIFFENPVLSTSSHLNSGAVNLFFAKTTYRARPNRSMSRCVDQMTNTACQLPIKKNGAAYTTE